MTAVDQPLAPRHVSRELLSAMRPAQWVKNALVLAAPAAAGVLLHPGTLLRCLVAVLSVTATASGCYLVNDLRDLPLDRLHPRKRSRPVASGAVPVRLVRRAAVVLLALGLGLAVLTGGGTWLVTTTYAVLTLAYAAFLKRLAWLEMGVVASGFVLRTLAGASAARVPASGWFLLVVSGAAVHVVASKRSSELVETGSRTRPVLQAYTVPSLRRLRQASAVLLVISYAGWAVVRPTLLAVVLAGASTVPLIAVLSRWNLQTEDGRTDAPEDVLVHDRVVRLGVIAWAVLFTGTVVVVTSTR